jgi:hypothetical protein
MRAMALKRQLTMHLRILGFGLPQDGNVGVSVFPEGEEVFARVSRNKSRRSFRRGGCPEFEALLEGSEL